MLKFGRFTRRAVLYVGYRCNLLCSFCYYASRDKSWHTLDHCIDQANIFRQRYNNLFVDITGGEPTIYPDILPLVSHCAKIGLKPRLITNMQVLADIDKVSQLKDAGIKDFLCSVHGLDEQYNSLTGVPDSFSKVVRALDNINALGIPYAANVVITNINFQHLTKIAEFLVNRGCKMVNYISCNIFEPQRQSAYLLVEFSELSPYLQKALDFCDSKGLIARVRYVPFCFVGKHIDKCYNFSQLPYDFYEWDCKSWMSVDSASPGVTKVQDKAYSNMSNEQAYQLLTSTLTDTNYKYPSACASCGFKKICDGLNVRYIERFGEREVVPQPGPVIDQPDRYLNLGPVY